MSKYLIIVESPAKARTIGKFLGPDYTVTASMGHVRDLPERDLGFDPAKNFEPQYQISKDKEKIIKALRKAIRPDTTVFLATDEDREGESISWHLVAALGLDDRPVQRIVFHEVTKSAILNALRNPRELDQKLVDAQQARRILDRAVGYELSPLLWRKVKPGLSAGRVQSVAVRIIVDREREIREFEPEEYWRLKAQFPGFEAELAKINGKTAKVPNEDAAQAIETSVRSGTWAVQSVTEKETQRQPPPPFTTSTLQQEASVKLGFSVKHTMSVAQQLYEGNFEIPGYSGGLITYMRTDSVTLSEDSLKQAQQVVTQEFGAKFSLPTPRRFRNRSKNAQEAHEAIRPVDLSKTQTAVRGFLKDEQARLYELIWRRMVAGQMAAANFARTVVQVEAGVQRECLFEAKGQRILFPGFLRAYVREGEDPGVALGEKDVILPHVEQGQTLSLEGFSTEQLFTKPPARYTEATLVKKLESEGIGRPSTYAPTISTIQERKYVERRDTDKRLQPTDIGEVVNDFLANHFEEIVNLGFTAKIERQFDHIAQGDEDWISMLGGFYFPFHQRVEEKGKSVTRAEASAMRVLGTDPKSGRELSVRMGRFGPMVQIGTKDDEDKPLFASIPVGSNMHELTLEQALDCFALPRTLGQDEAGEEVSVGRGRYGPYVRIQREYHSLPVDEDPMAVTLERALEIIREGRETKAKSLIQDFGEIRVLNGRFGPYIKQGKNNYKIPKGTDPETLDEAACQQIIADAPPPGARRSRGTARRKSA